jgi:hypothetical protein
MLPAQSVHDRSGPLDGEATRIPKIVKIVLNSCDLDEPISLNMYNVVREGLSAAEKVLTKGGSVGLELQDGPGSTVRHRILTSVSDLDPWRDVVNHLTVLGNPSPRIPGL